MPTCDHATIAAMYAKAIEEKLDSCIFNYKTQIGVLPFEIVKNNTDYQVVMTQGGFELESALNTQLRKKLYQSWG